MFPRIHWEYEGKEIKARVHFAEVEYKRWLEPAFGRFVAG